MTNAQITAALDAGIITEAQAKALRADNDSRRKEDGATIGNEENLRFIRGFSDVFIAMGLCLAIFGLSALASLMGGGMLYLAAAALMWVIAEYFGRKKRTHLPTLISALAFLGFIHAGAAIYLAKFGFNAPILSHLITLGAMVAFYLRIGLPFCIALIALSALFVILSLTRQFLPEFSKSHLGIIWLLSGLLMFGLALFYDMKDQHRTSRFADNAFWLHLSAAPLIIHGLALETITHNMTRLFGIIPVIKFEPGHAIIILIFIGILSLIGLAINRRALIVSALFYALIAVGSLLGAAGLSFGNMAAITLLIIGAFIVALGTVWHPLRNQFIRFLPKWIIFPPAFIADYDPRHIP